MLFKHKEMYDLVPNPKIYGKEENRTKLISYTEKRKYHSIINEQIKEFKFFCCLILINL